MKKEFKNIKINYEILGNGNDWLVFLHGWGCNYKIFQKYIDEFVENFKILAIDFPPFGDSDEMTEPWNIFTYKDMVNELFIENKIENAKIFSHSFGGRVAILLASEYNYVDKLVLCGSAGLKPRFNICVYLKKKINKIYNLLKLKPPQNLGSSDYKKLSPIMKKTFSNIVSTHFDNVLCNITCPTLLIWGSKDNDTPLYMAKKLYKKIKNSQLIVFKNCSHFVFLENYSRLKNILNTFFEGD